MINYFPDVSQIRPHVKTHKNAAVVQLCMDAGIHKFKCATVAEVSMLAHAGAKDVLMAFQPVGPKINRLLDLVKDFPSCKFSCLVDNRTSAEQLSLRAKQYDLQLHVHIDLNIGMDRKGLG